VTDVKTNREEAANHLRTWHDDDTGEGPVLDALTALLDRKKAEWEAETVERCARVCDGVLSSEFCAQRIRALLPGAKP
jgi:hypothetical protein